MNTVITSKEIDSSKAAASACGECVCTTHADAAGAAVNPPASNTGGLVSEAYTTYVMVDGKPKEVLLKRGSDSAAFIDTLTITMKEDVFIRDDQLGTDEEIACNVSAELAEIMGFGLSEQKNGRNGYAISYQMGSKEENYGFCAFGGKHQNGSLCIYFTGVGLVAAKDGWESRLYEFIKTRSPYAKITRVDLAHDFLEGEYTPDMALAEWEDGKYTSRHTRPVAECAGGDWLQFSGSGKTLYIGSRKNGSRFARIYEKGRQLGDKESEWVRVELEMHARDIIIPHEVLIQPGQFLTGAYPAFQELFEKYRHVPEKAERVKKTKDVGVQHVQKYASMQCAPAIVMMRELGLNDEQIVEALLDGHKDLPKRLRKEAFDCSDLNIQFIHEFKRFPRSDMEVIDALELGVGGAKMRHRTMNEYLKLKEQVQLDRQFNRGASSNRQTYEEYMWQRYHTPDFILNPRKV